MSNLWEEEKEEEFRDVPDEVQMDSNGIQMQSAPVRVTIQQSQPVIQSNRPLNVPAEPTASSIGPMSSELEEVLELEEDFTEILNDANLRIEQGRLYQMIMNHDLFEGMEADPRAVQNVQREIRKFARESMEVMLGMRQIAPKNTDIVSSPFNDLEVDILKKIASKATNGATESAEANKMASTLRETPKKKTFNPIGGSTALKKSVPLQNKPQAPLQRKKSDATIEQILAEEGVPRELIEENYVPIGKPLDKLTSQERAERESQTMERLARRKTVKSSSALPMASIEQQELLALQRATQIGQSPGMAQLLEKVKNMPIKNP